MDSAEQRIVAFTAGSHGLVHTYELSIPILLTVWVGEFSTTAAVLGLVVTVGYGLFGVGTLRAASSSTDSGPSRSFSPVSAGWRDRFSS